MSATTTPRSADVARHAEHVAALAARMQDVSPAVADVAVRAAGLSVALLQQLGQDPDTDTRLLGGIVSLLDVIDVLVRSEAG
jgi:hypothetical protein